jgi:hypothetical protein
MVVASQHSLDDSRIRVRTAMPSKTPISLAARERLRDHQAASAKAVAAYSNAMDRLDIAMARRAKVLGAQDRLVAAANAEVVAAVIGLAEVVGVEIAAGLLDLSKAEVRRVAKGVS